jgi:hypothetical protein
MKNYGDSIGKVYLYLFSMLGLVLIVIGSSGLINLGLKNTIFSYDDPWMSQPPVPYWTNKMDTLSTCEDLSEEDKVLLQQWLREYEAWESTSNKRVNKSQNYESASRNLALLLVGLPLFIFHWRLIRKKE